MQKRLLPENLERNLLAALLAAMGVCMLTAAITRHLYPNLHPYTLKTAGGCLTWIASFGMARAAALGLHVRMSFIESFITPLAQKRLSILADTAFLLFAAFSLIVGCAVLVTSLDHPKNPSHPLIYASIPLGSILTIIRLTQRLRRQFGEKDE